MRSTLARFVVVFFIVYASLFGGIAEHIPIMKLIHQGGVTILLVVWLAHRWRTRRPFPSTPFDWPVWLAGVGWLAAAIASRDPRVSLEFTWPIFVHILLIYLFVDLMGCWKPGARTPRLLATSLTRPAEILQLYLRRLWIEELFAHLIGQSFNRESSHLRTFWYLSRLTLSVAWLRLRRTKPTASLGVSVRMVS